MEYDVAVIGGGIAGASAAAQLAQKYSVILCERESHPGYHATGRSAALFSEIYGNEVVRALTVASRAFLESSPAGFTTTPILTPRGAMHIGGEADTALLDQAFESARSLVSSVRRIDADEVLQIVPVIRRDYVAGGVYEPDARDIDTNGMLQGFLRQLREAGGRILLDAEVTGLEKERHGWRIQLPNRELKAGIIVNAAGAWADQVAAMGGATAIGLMPKRRTAFLFRPHQSLRIEGWPLVIGARESFYFKPDAGLILVSPADETPSLPVDAQPDELDVAIAADRVMAATMLDIRRIEHKWAGLRTFTKDKSPVAGFDPSIGGFFWLAGQGGYGFQTAVALSRVAANLVGGLALPSELQDLGITGEMLSPARFSA
ncbi:NAD(P)/FAD-dependent oxidoreductase [Dongia soli]|uniref:FAD-binding oxidoreductase n=1 Tax=Dongia soli TaxID=600628 RepID=A0ABU5E9B1_9PROT|nr:FAD-binding oxidoreductase [Dongia soli]MDY0882600.1 FAD-binding oxidoreductase [Dongia soli]